MKNISCFLILTLIFFPITLNAQNEKFINIFLNDITGSMLGKGDGMGVDIFNEVKNVAVRIIRSNTYDTYLVIIPFGRGVQENNIFEIHIQSDRDKEKALQFIQGLKATEPETWLTYSLRYGVNKLRELEKKLPDFLERGQQILLMTDGKGNGPGDLDNEGKFTTDNLINEYVIARSDFPNLYTRFLSIGDVLGNFDREKFQKAGIGLLELERDNLKIESTTDNQLKDFVSKSKPIIPKRLLDYLPYFLAALILILLMTLLSYRYHRNKRGLKQMSAELNKSTQILTEKTNTLRERLRVQEGILDNDRKITESQPEQLIRIRPNFSFAIGADAKTCSFVMKSEKAPSVLVSVTFGDTGESIELRNESALPVDMNNQSVKSGQSRRFAINEKVSVLYSDKIVVTLEKVLIRNDRKTEADFFARLVNENQTSNEEMLSKQQ